jgi:hypothetical protein
MSRSYSKPIDSECRANHLKRRGQKRDYYKRIGNKLLRKISKVKLKKTDPDDIDLILDKNYYLDPSFIEKRYVYKKNVFNKNFLTKKDHSEKYFLKK